MAQKLFFGKTRTNVVLVCAIAAQLSTQRSRGMLKDTVIGAAD
jgi:hypothetical protein